MMLQSVVCAAPEPGRRVRACCRCWKNAFWLVTLLYPRCSMTALEMFSYSDLDIGRCARLHVCVRSPEEAACACTNLESSSV